MENFGNEKGQRFIPGTSRIAVMWLGSLSEARAVLDCCAGLRRLYLVENSADRLEKFRASAAAKQVLDDNRVRVVHAGPDSLNSVVKPLFETDFLLFAEGRIGVYLAEEYCGMEPEFTARLRAFILDHARAVISACATRAVRGWHMLCNSIFNIHDAPFRGTVGDLNGIAAGKPVVIVGAGPSLDGNIADLAGRRAVVIACDSAWRALDRHGIVPDIVVTTDGDEAVWRFFAGLAEKHPDVAIVNTLRGSWTTGRYHRGLILTGRAPDEEPLCETCGFDIPLFESGKCVGHAAFETARLLGADPLIMIGFDLGYSGARFHAMDMAVPYFKDNPPLKENIVSVPGIDGNPVMTDLSMLLYLREFERRIAEFNGLVIDATEGGALITGAQTKSLRSALDKFSCDKPDINGILKTRLPDQDTTLDASRNVSEKLSSLAGLADRLMVLVEEAKTNIEAVLSSGQEAFPALAPYDELLQIVACTYGSNVFAGFKLAWEDWVSAGGPRPVHPDLLESAQAYLEAVGTGARVLYEAVPLPEISRNALPDIKTVLAFNRGATHEPYLKIIEALRASGSAVTEYAGDTDNIPEIWRVLRETRAGMALIAEGALFPAAWAMAGCCCLDVRSSAEGMESLYPYWLPGYGVVCPDFETFELCRTIVPPDRPAGFVKADGMVCIGASDISIKSYVKTLFEEVGYAKKQKTC